MSAMVILTIRQKLYRRIVEMALVSAGLLLIPLSFMSIVIMAPEVSLKDITGILMIPHMNFFYVFLIVLTEVNVGKERELSSLRWLVFLCCGFMGFTLAKYTQVFQNCMEMELNRSYALGQRIITKIEELPQYEIGMKLIVGGTAEQGNYPRSYPEMYDVVKGTAVEYGFFWNTMDGRQYCWNEFLRQYLGVEYGICSQEEMEMVFNSEEYAEMPIFPQSGSVEMIGDCAVVKLSEVD